MYDWRQMQRNTRYKSCDTRFHLVNTREVYFLLSFFIFYKQLNDIRLDCVTHDVAVNEFRKADESVSLLVEKNAETYLLVSIV